MRQQPAFRRAHSLALVLLVLTACHKDQTRGVDGKPEAPDTIDFGLVPVNGRFVRALPVSNTGAVALTLQDSKTDEPFGVSALPVEPLEPGSTADVTLSFSPIAPGEVNGTVTVFSNSIVAPAVDVKVHGIAYQPDLSISPTRLDFGTVEVGASASLTFSITNLAPVPLVPEVEPTELQSDFNAAPTGYLDSLAGSASTQVTVSFAPSHGGPQRTVLTISCAQCPVKQLELTGLGHAQPPPPPPDAGAPDSGPPDSGAPDAGTPDAGPPDSGPPPELECALVAAPLDVDFGSLQPGQSARQAVVYKNQGTGPCYVQKPYLGAASDRAFSLEAPAAFTLQVSDTRALTAHFEPTTATPPGPTGQLLAVSNDKAGPLNVSLHAVTLPPPPPPPPPAHLVVTPLKLFFTAEVPNAPGSQTLLLQNTGGVALSFTGKSDDAKLTLAGASGSLAAGDATTVTVSVAGQATAGHRVSHVTIDAGSAGKAVVDCDLTFTSAPPPPPPAARLVVLPAALTFSAEINTTPPAQALVASNTGGQGLTWTGTSDDPALTIAPLSGALAAGASSQVTVRVATQATVGSRVQTLTFDGGAAGTALVKVTIEFHQTTPPPPPPQYGASVWPKFHHDNGNTGLSTIDTSKTKGAVAHKTFLSAPPACRLLGGFWRCGTYQASPSLGADGTVYQVGGDGKVRAIDPNSGKVKWAVTIGEPMLASAESDITVVKSGHFFVHAHGGGGTTPQFFKIADTGSIVWQNTPAGVDGNGKRLDGFDSAPAIDYDGDLYLMNEDAKKIGEWDQRSVKLADATLGSVSVNAFSHGAALTTDKLSFWQGAGVLWAVDGKTARLLWSAQDPAVTGALLSFAKASPLITNDGVLITTFGWREGTSKATYKYYTRISAWQPTATKKQLWTKLLTTGAGTALKPLDSHVDADEEVRYNLGTSSIAQGPDGTLYVGAADGLYALDPKNKGATKWGIGTGPVVSSPAVGADGRVYFGSMDGNLYAARNGALVWQVKTGGQVNSSPAIGADGSIFAVADDGNLYIVK